jgi:hypothetical protein
MTSDAMLSVFNTALAATASVEEAVKAVAAYVECERKNVDVGNQAADGDDNLAYLRQHPQESIQKDKVICLESGKGYKLLSNRHLALYGLTPREYKKKWNIPQTTPLSIPTKIISYVV